MPASRGKGKPSTPRSEALHECGEGIGTPVLDLWGAVSASKSSCSEQRKGKPEREPAQSSPEGLTGGHCPLEGVERGKERKTPVSVTTPASFPIVVKPLTRCRSHGDSGCGCPPHSLGGNPRGNTELARGPLTSSPCHARISGTPL